MMQNIDIQSEMPDIKILQKIQNDFSDLFGIPTVIVNSEGIPITYPSNITDLYSYIRASEKGNTFCQNFNKKVYETTADKQKAQFIKAPYISQLIWAAAPIKIDGKHLASFCAQQIRVGEISEDELLQLAGAIGADATILSKKTAYLKMFSEAKLKNLSKFLDYTVNIICKLSSENNPQKVFTAEQQFKADLPDSINEFITATDLEGNIIYANQKVKTHFDIFSNQTTSIRMFGESPDEGATQNEILNKTKELGSWQGEVVNFDKNGNKIYMHCRTHLLKDANGKEIGMVGISNDISQQKNYQALLERKNHLLEQRNFEYKAINEKLVEAKNAAEEQQQILSAVSNQSSDGITIADFNGKYTFVNPAFCQMSGYSREELLTMSATDMIADKKARNLFLLTINEMEGRPVRMKLKRKDGSEYIAEVVANKLNTGKENLAVGIIRDISQFVKRENELWLAKKKAEESNRLKSAFLNNITHEFRTPMNGILGFTDMLAMDADTDEKKGYYLSVIQDSCKRLLEIVDDTVELSQIQSNDLELQFEAVDLGKLIESLAETSKRKAERKGIEFQFNVECRNNKSLIITDLHKLKRSLKHILDNALKFTQKGSITLTCLYEKENIIIHVKDTGIGISRKMQEVVFEPYRQVESHLRRNFSGNGIGLALVKAYIQMLGGTVSLSSEETKGTTVTVCLPPDARIIQ